MTAVKTDKIIFSAYKIQTGRLRFFQINFLHTAVLYARASRNDIQIRKHAVKQRNPHICHRILQVDFQCVGLLIAGIDCRKLRQSIFSFCNAVAPVAKIASIRAVRISNNNRRASVISRSLARKLLGKNVHRIRAVVPHVIGISGKSPVCKLQQIIHVPAGLFSIIQMQ